MKRSIKTALLGTLVAANALMGTASLAVAGSGLPLIRMAPKINHTIQITPRVQENLRGVITAACVDLAVFANQQRLPDGRVRITYGVRNVSSVDYVSGGNQQSVALDKNGSSLGYRGFSNLPAGQTLSWSLIVGTPFEFPDTYRALLTTDPDIFMDGNPRNDDCNRGNNARQVTVSA